MSENQVYDKGDSIACAPTAPASPSSGDPVVLGTLGGVAQTTKDTVSGLTTVAFVGVFNLSVKGVNGSGNTAVAAGDTLYYVSGDTPPVSEKTSGVKFGTALDPITSGSTTTIRVRLSGAPA